MRYKEDRHRQYNGTVRTYPERKVKKPGYAFYVEDIGFNMRRREMNETKMIFLPSVTGIDDEEKDVDLRTFVGAKLNGVGNMIECQTLADLLGYVVVVEVDSGWFGHSKLKRGVTDKYDGGGGGNPCYDRFSQRSEKENRVRKGRKIWWPRCGEGLDEPTKMLRLVANIDPNSYQFKIQMKKSIGFSNVCRGCWKSDGRMWALKGLGKKSVCKNKGKKKRRFDFEI